ncbi:hypothetical protein KSF78_0000693 [Schistosoma japonicum]|nr:hypothetical protein KSF78_0000693 [Schistosoma japonicum]
MLLQSVEIKLTVLIQFNVDVHLAVEGVWV